MFRHKKAQSTLEYAILIGFVAAALITSQIILKRHYQGKLRESAQSMGEQFSPGITTNEYTTTSSTVSTETVRGGESATVINNQTSDRTGHERIDVNEREYFPQ